MSKRGQIHEQLAASLAIIMEPLLIRIQLEALLRELDQAETEVQTLV